MWTTHARSAADTASYWYRWFDPDEIEWKRTSPLDWPFQSPITRTAAGRVAPQRLGLHHQTFGFGYIRELELLAEAVCHPLEVIRWPRRRCAAPCGLQTSWARGGGKSHLAGVTTITTEPTSTALAGRALMRLDEVRPTLVDWHRVPSNTRSKDGVDSSTRPSCSSDVLDLVKASWREGTAPMRPPSEQSTGERGPGETGRAPYFVVPRRDFSDLAIPPRVSGCALSSSCRSRIAADTCRYRGTIWLLRRLGRVRRLYPSRDLRLVCRCLVATSPVRLSERLHLSRQAGDLAHHRAGPLPRRQRPGPPSRAADPPGDQPVLSKPGPVLRR